MANKQQPTRVGVGTEEEPCGFGLRDEVQRQTAGPSLDRLGRLSAILAGRLPVRKGLRTVGKMTRGGTRAKTMAMLLNVIRAGRRKNARHEGDEVAPAFRLGRRLAARRILSGVPRPDPWPRSV